MLVLGVGISIPLYMSEALLEGVKMAAPVSNGATKRQLLPVTAADKNITAISPSLLNVNSSTQGLTTPPTNTTTQPTRLGHHSVFAIAFWMQLTILGLMTLTFILALIKHVKKRKERLAAPYALPRYCLSIR